MFGQYQKVNLRILEVPAADDEVKSLKMELRDCAYECIKKVDVQYDHDVGFKDADVAILIGAKRRQNGQTRQDLLKDNAKIFES